MKRLALVVLIVIVYATGQTAKVPQVAKPKTTAEANVAQNHVGKYQIFFSPHARADVYLVDTETGQIWTPFTISNATDTKLNGAPQVWIYQDRIDTEQQFDVWMAFHKPPTPAAAPRQ